jgi:diguanylate cyclase (GGDEF)-like protein/PAS domain S-box-containing protein
MRLDTDCATLVAPTAAPDAKPECATATPAGEHSATSFMAIEHAMLEMLATHAPLPQVLEPLVRGYEALFPGLSCAITTGGTDGELPQRIAGAALDPVCESVPILAHQGTPLGQLDISFASASLWAAEGQKAAKRIGYLAGLALEREHSKQQTKTEQASLQESARHHRNILDNMLDGVITVSKHGLIESVNKSVCAIFGYDADELLGINIAVLMPEPADPEGSHQGRQLQRLHNSGSNYLVGKPRETMGERKDGRSFPMSLSVSKIARKNKPTFVIVVRDITQRRQSEEEIHRLAFYDPLTELPNRRLLIDRLKQATVTSARTGQYGAVMFLDLDQFKLLNDTQGHAMGDELLKQVATRLKTCVRLGDSVARLGGDEFVVLLERLSDSTLESAVYAQMVAGKVLAVLGQPYKLRGHVHSSTPSIGVVMFLGDQDSTDQLLKQADVAMYQAKASGRNTARFFDPTMQVTANMHAALETDLRRGLYQHEFVLLYQFQFDTMGEPVGAEALLRWNHATRGLVPPLQFVGLAEETSMGLVLGQWVLETACTQLRVWSNHAGTAQWTLAVNVSPTQFAQASFVTNVTSALKRAGANPHLLTLELTESMLMSNLEDTLAKMQALSRVGVRFSLDDFGTGYSSLMQLQRLPLHQLKIDRSFVNALLTTPNDAAVARSTVALGHSMGMTVVAEGVETAEQRNALATLGCDIFQGYYYGRPAPAHELAASMRKIA